MINEAMEEELEVKDLEDLNGSVAYFLELKKQQVSGARQLDEVKARIDAYLDAHQDLFGGQICLEIAEGRILIANNPPRAVWADSGKALTTDERRDFASKLPEGYCSLSIDMLRVSRGKATDKKLRSLLKAARIEIAQDTRYDVKQPVNK